MFKRNLVLVLVTLCLVVSLFFAFSGATGQVLGASTKYPIVALTGPGGSISPAGIVPVTSGTSKTFAIKPNKGFRIADVQVDGVSAGRVLKYTFTNVTSPHRILALFAANLLINAGAGDGGSISPSGLVTVTSGGNQIFTITPEEGFYIGNVIVDGKPVGQVNTFQFKKVAAPHSIMAVFNSVYPILATASAGGSIDPSGVVMVDAGHDQEYAITPDPGFHITDVRVDASWKGPVSSWNFTDVKAPHDILVLFSDKYTLVSKAGPGGTITPDGPTVVIAGTSQHYDIAPKSGYFIQDVMVDGASVGAVTAYDFIDVTAPHLIIATFTRGTPPT
jgi:hypothetical protein